MISLSCLNITYVSLYEQKSKQCFWCNFSRMNEAIAISKNGLSI